ncbi:MAG: HD domain-containing protein [Lachnospiraceae bacterium]|nr:HD domain-containing protein [Lachnospiraceae bacterium]
MKKIDRDTVKQAFASYSDKYDSSDPKIKLKIDHTYRVASLCDRIAKTVPGTNEASAQTVPDPDGTSGMTDTPFVDHDLAWLSGMLHDVGRFEQVRRFGTFSDAQSVDHAAFGADLLFKEGLVDSFGSFDPEQKEILETAIRNHNRFRIDEGLPENIKAYCNILRDADKIDIFRVNIDTPLEEIYNVSSEELARSSVSDAVKQGFIEGHAILRSARKTSVDILVGHISLVYELVYPVSVEIAKEQGYIHRMLDFSSENEDTREWFEFMKKTLQLRGLS